MLWVIWLPLGVLRTGREAWPESVGHVQGMNQELKRMSHRVVDSRERVVKADSRIGMRPWCTTQRGVWVYVKQQSNFVGLCRTAGGTIFY